MWITIANHLWQSTLFVLLIGALCHLLRHDGAHVRYWLWWAASVKFLLPFSLLTALGARFADWAALAPVPELWSSTMTSVANPFTATEASWSIGAVVLAAWLAGTGLVLTNWIVRAAKLRRVVESATQDSAPLRAAGQWISVYRADARVEPGVIGILRTALLLPNGIEKRLTPAQLEAVLAHELCHIRRRDNLTAAVHMLVEAVFWFHPLVWWVGAKLIDERER
ncbi:MAG: M56 family metallopeptidase, partial [Gammaproteobacteria bacterium]|nr:M56 family metallopeptidase [Gammaproteobacteria bacterium]